MITQLWLINLKVAIFVQGWTGYGRGVVEKLQTRTFFPKQLEKVNWQMGLQMAQAASTKMKVPNALFELVVHDKEVCQLLPINAIVLNASSRVQFLHLGFLEIMMIYS